MDDSLGRGGTGSSASPPGSFPIPLLSYRAASSSDRTTASTNSTNSTRCGILLDSAGVVSRIDRVADLVHALPTVPGPDISVWSRITAGPFDDPIPQ